MANPTAPVDPHWHNIAAEADLDADFPTGVEIDGVQIGLYKQGDAVCAIEDVCPHAYALLSQGFVESGKVECPLHGAQFEIATGKCLTEIGQRDLRVFPVRVVDGRVHVQVTPTA
jgi:nitrite reductase/ring-hydroxylating ferredoxin subunit